MKKFIFIVLVLCAVATLSACGGDEGEGGCSRVESSL